MNNNLPLVSIVIPVYNREELINDAIRSSCAQTYKNIEIVIVDNHSKDNTWQVVQNWARMDSRIRVFQNETNLGPVRNWDRCFNEAKGEYIKILWSDDWMEETFIEEAMKRMDDNTAFVMSATNVVKSNEDVILSYSFKHEIITCQFYLNEMLFVRGFNFPVSPGCALFRTKDVIESLIISVPNHDGLDSSLNGAGNDLLLFLQIALKYQEIHIIPKVSNFFRAHDGSISICSNIGNYYEWARLFFVESVIKDYSKLPIIKYWSKKQYYNTITNYLQSYTDLTISYIKFWCLINSNKYNEEEINLLLDHLSLTRFIYLFILVITNKTRRKLSLIKQIKK